jgi:uncharacterized protein (TIGR00251 family)
VTPAPFLREVPDGIVLNLRVMPRASANAIAGLQGDALKVRVTAPPVGSAANAGVVRGLAASLGVPRGTVRLLRGATGRQKQVLVQGCSPARALEALGPWIGPGT